MMLIVSLLPIFVLMVMLGILKCSMFETVLVCFIVTGALAIFLWDFPIVSFLLASLEGILMGAFPIVFTIVAALFAYRLTVTTGNIEKIKAILMSVSKDTRIQVLLIVWGFGVFLESISGYGTSVAIPLVMLISLGFHPMTAALVCLLSNTASTAFGALGIPVITLAKVSGHDVNALTYFTALQLTPFVILLPFLLLMVSEKNIFGFKGVGVITLLSGISFAIPQLLLASYVGPEMVSLVGSISSIIVVILLSRNMKPAEKATCDVSLKEGIFAFLPYIFTLVLLMILHIPTIHQLLQTVKTVITVYHSNHQETPLTFQWLLMPGTIILLATYIAGWLQGMSFGSSSQLLASTIRQLALSSLSIFIIIAISRIMLYSGMLQEIERYLTGMGKSFALLAPTIGALGTFLTGSDTSSGILFGKLESNVASRVGLDPLWITASCLSGATAGKMLSLQNILIATNAAGIQGSENSIFKTTLVYCAGYLLVLALIVFFFSESR